MKKFLALLLIFLFTGLGSVVTGQAFYPKHKKHHKTMKRMTQRQVRKMQKGTYHMNKHGRVVKTR